MHEQSITNTTLIASKLAPTTSRQALMPRRRL